MPDDARALFKRALEAGNERDYKRASELLTSLLAQTDAFPEALLYLGRARHALGETGMAVDAIRRYLRSGGDQAAGCFFLGRSYLACGEIESAIASLRRSAQADGDRAETWALLGAACLRAKRTKAAVDCLERAVTLAPQDRRVFRGYLNALYARGVRLASRGASRAGERGAGPGGPAADDPREAGREDSELAAQMLGFVLSNGLDGAAIRLWRAKALRDSGDTARALAECEAALALAPSDSSIRWVRSGLLLAAGRRQDAFAEFEALRAADPRLPQMPQDGRALARLRASSAFREGRPRDALAAALEILRAEPRDAAVLALAAESLRSLGEAARSRNFWERAIAVAPGESSFRLGLAYALWELGDFKAALSAIGRARGLGADPLEADYCEALCRSRLGEDPESLLPLLQSLVRSKAGLGEAPDPRLLFALGEALYRSGRPDLAGGWFEKVNRLVPEHELSLLYAISVAESLDDQDGRARAYAAYLDRYPDNAKIRRECVELLCARGEWEGAAACLERGLLYGGMGDKARRLLASCYRSAGRYREAAVVYRELLRADPSSAELLTALAFCLDRDGKGAYALALLEKAPAAAKAAAGPWILMGSLLARSGRSEAAIDAMRRASELEPGQESPWRRLAALYDRAGLRDFAAASLERAEAIAEARRRAAGPPPGRDASPGGPGLADLESRSRRDRPSGAKPRPGASKR